MSVSRETTGLPVASFLEWFGGRLDKQSAFTASAFSGPRSFVGLYLLTFSLREKRLQVVCPDAVLAEDLYRICFNLRETGVYWFPDRQAGLEDVVGFDRESERFQSEAYNYLNSAGAGILFLSDAALKYPVKSPEARTEKGYTVKAGDVLSKEMLVKTLVSWGYEPQDRATFPKSFSSRGGILDIFLLYSKYPVRLEFFGDTIDSMRTFNPLSQRQVEPLPMVAILPPPGGLDSIPDVPLGDLTIQDSRTVRICQLSTNELEVTMDTPTHSNRPDFLFNVNFNSLLYTDDVFHPLRKFIFSDDKNQHKLLLKKFGSNIEFVAGILEYGFSSSALNLACYSASEILRQTSVGRYRWTLDNYGYAPQETIAGLDDIDWGDYLVHRDYGIGLYRGLENLVREDHQQECIKIEFADNGVVYVPVDKFNKVHKLIITRDHQPALSSLGSRRWSQQKQRARSAAEVVIKDLVSMYAARSQSRGFKYSPDNELCEAVEASFPYEETPDQTVAIQNVVRDMESERPLDRLICGDVGFGKTEVAIRATIKAVTSGKGVLFLTPTTILADQHFISLSSRLEPAGVLVELLSRFRKKSEQLVILEAMYKGTVDVVIGTHRLLSEDVRFPNLGLLIIDEEHRFGVKHKEKLKQLRQNVDVLTLTATPIPRTLQQSLVGIRDISKIQTAPKTRKPIQTYIKYFEWSLIQKIITAELNRGGQVYFLHNDIAALSFYYQELASRFPDASIAIAHGKMKSDELERAVLAFFRGDVDILLCTTIIESGLDVANANTIIITQAHLFGLAQLYQIRGRVGRGYRQAYCLLCLPSGYTLQEDAYLRLKAIEQHTSLGSGLDIAMKDLEIRGAGNLFGYKQSGHIAAVGFELYCQILREAVDEATEPNRQAVEPPRLVAHETTLLDPDYVALIQDRLYFYKRLSEASSLTELSDIQDEIRDRFGPLPDPARRLIDIARLRVLFTGSPAQQIQIDRKTLSFGLVDFTPFLSFQEMLNGISKTLAPFNCPFRLEPDGKGASIKLKIRTGNLSESFSVATSLGRLFTDHNV